MRQGLTPQAKSLGEQARQIVLCYVRLGSASDVAAICGVGVDDVNNLLSTVAGGNAVRAEIMRQLATDGARIGYQAIKHVAQDRFAPAAARVAAGKVLLQAAGLVDAAQAGKPGEPGKSISQMSRAELLAFMESKRSEIEQVERELGDRATPINAPVAPVS